MNSLSIEVEFQFSKILPVLGLECGKIYIRHHFKGIRWFKTHYTIPVVILFPSNKELQSREPQIN